MGERGAFVQARMKRGRADGVSAAPGGCLLCRERRGGRRLRQRVAAREFRGIEGAAVDEEVVEPAGALRQRLAEDQRTAFLRAALACGRTAIPRDVASYETLGRRWRRASPSSSRLQRGPRTARLHSAQKGRSIADSPVISCDPQRISTTVSTRNCFLELSCASRRFYRGESAFMHAETLTSDIDRFKEAALSASSGRRADRREMGVPDPSRRAQRPQAFRGIPGGARNCPQHPLRPAFEDGGRRDPAAGA